MTELLKYILGIGLLLAGPFATAEDFAQQDIAHMDRLNAAYYKNVERFGTRSFHHGKKTETAYVFLHGLFMDGSAFLSAANDLHQKGANVIVGTIPGHDLKQLVVRENSAGLWLSYAEYLGMIARYYGQKVIFVGHSTGGNLAVRAAEKGFADGLILIQPLFGVSAYVKNAMRTGDLLPEGVQNNLKADWLSTRALDGHRATAQEILNAGEQAETLASLEYYPLKENISVEIYIADKDPVVSSKATVDWAKTYAPQARLHHHDQPWNHMYRPF